MWASPKRLVRGEILKKLPQESRRSAGRVGQILAALHDENLLDRVFGKAQGSNAAGFYSLSSEGRLLCQDLGFAQQVRFAASPDILKTNLTRQRLAAAVERSGRIVAAWGIRGGLGRTTLVAHVAKGLAEKLTTDDQRLLAVDLDFASPDLDGFFAPRDEPKCRGLGGLLMDFQRCEPKKRAFFLLRALRDPKYVIQVKTVPRLIYLPSGLSPSHQALSAAERVEALALLRREAERYAAARNDAGESSAVSGNSAGDSEGPGFLAALRAAMATRFERVVIDAQQGHSLGAWIATQALADELVLCLHHGKDSQTSIAAIRATLACFLALPASEGQRGAVKFMFRLAAPTTLEDLDRWVDEHVVMEKAAPALEVAYGSEQIPYNARLAEKRYRGKNTHFYRHLIAKLRPGSAADREFCPPELQALKIVLSGKNPNERSIAAGVLENTPIEELARWIRWTEGEGSLPRMTDAEGARLLRSVLETHAAELFRKVLGSQVSWDPEE